MARRRLCAALGLFRTDVDPRALARAALRQKHVAFLVAAEAFNPLPAIARGAHAFFALLQVFAQRALELGCSHGAFLQQLRDCGWECVGIEPAAEVASRAAERGLDVRVGSLESLVATDPQTFAPSSFDAVFAWM